MHDARNIAKDSHNVGKTFLIRVIDFLLMSGVDKDHPFRQHADRFGDFVFFGEFLANDGSYITVRRPVKGRADIAINVSSESHQDFSSIPTKDWRHHSLSVDRAEELLGSYFALTSINPYDFRKGLGYFLRRQSDYEDEFRITRFGRGKDLDWKPFTAMLLGFDHNIIRDKYLVDQDIDSRRALLKQAKSDAGSGAEYDEIKGLWQARKMATERLRAQVASFDFRDVESEINAETVVQIESEISRGNRARYEMDRELAEIDRSLRPDYQFDLEAIQRVFADANLYFPNQLRADYEALENFNREIAVGRRSRLQALRGVIAQRRSLLLQELGKLNARRQEALSTLKEQRTLDKYRQLNARLLEEEEVVRQLRSSLDMLDRAEQISQEISRLQQQQIELAESIRRKLREDNAMYSRVRSVFYELTTDIIGTPAILAVDPNSYGNLEFKTKVLQVRDNPIETSLSEGTSYRKLLCVCLDLSLLIAHSSLSFYRFVYHDGVFEGLDNRRKASLLAAVQRECDRHGLQYVLTVIDADLPRNSEDHRLFFEPDRVVRELDDTGNDGRLFRMDPF